MVCVAAGAIILAGCSSDNGRCTIAGEIEGLAEAELLVYSTDGSAESIDTVRVVGGEFRYDRSLAAPQIVTILFPNFSEATVIMSPGSRLTYKARANALSEAEIGGDRENELLTAFRRDINGKPEAQIRKQAARFIRENAATLAAQAVFVRYFAAAEQSDAATALPLLDLMVKAQPRNVGLVRLNQWLRPQLMASAGQKLPDFKAVTLDGDTLRSRSWRGQPAVIAFLGTWTRATYSHSPIFARMSREMKGRAHFLIVGVDEDVRAFERQMARDSFACPLVCQGEAFRAPLVRQLGVRYVPGNLLIDAKGKIVARDLAPTVLEEKLRGLLDSSK